MIRVRPARSVVMAVVVTVLLALPAGIVLAGSQTFDDVPPSHQFFDSIEAVAAANVTFGCGDGTNYCPNGLVTRGQMAAFMNRLGALSSGQTPKVNADRLDGLNSTAFGRAAVNVAGNGTRGVWFNRGGGAPTTTRTAEGIYTVAFPGKSFNVNNNFVATVTLVNNPGFATVDSQGGNLYIETFDTSGAAADLRFHVVVWDASVGG